MYRVKSFFAPYVEKVITPVQALETLDGEVTELGAVKIHSVRDTVMGTTRNGYILRSVVYETMDPVKEMPE